MFCEWRLWPQARFQRSSVGSGTVNDKSRLTRCAWLKYLSLTLECQRLGLKPTGDSGNADTWDDLYFRIWLNVIEPKLPQNQAVFVHGYPPSQSALSVIETHSDGSRWARRFEAYAGGLELCNAFEELTDPQEQRARFLKDMDLRTQLYGDAFQKTPLDEDFLEALAEGLPPSGGNALGVDRLIMLLADEPDIRYTFWLEAYAGLEGTEEPTR
ncbi:hypothetical protein EBZ37_13285 [bacterium]|nr:hypothetical protein [bacterium]